MQLSTKPNHKGQELGIALAALDLSLTHTGWARISAVLPEVESGVLDTTRHKVQLRDAERLCWLRDQILYVVRACELVAIEGYSFGSRNGREQAGELGGVVRTALFEANIRYAIIPPRSVKLFATGSGKASKPEMLAAAIKRLGYEGHNEHEVDALWLLAIVQYHFGQLPINLVPQTHLKALQKLVWPTQLLPITL